MQLTPREVERLLVFTAAELARRRLAEGILLSHPDAVALACRHGAGAGAARRELRGCPRARCTGSSAATSSCPGVAELLAGAAPGRGLLRRRQPARAARAAGGGLKPGELIPGDGPVPSAPASRRATVRIRNTGRFPAYIGSHFPLARASAALEFPRDGLDGRARRLSRRERRSASIPAPRSSSRSSGRDGLTRSEYASLYGPTTGDRVRLGDTDLAARGRGRRHRARQRAGRRLREDGARRAARDDRQHPRRTRRSTSRHERRR